MAILVIVIFLLLPSFIEILLNHFPFVGIFVLFPYLRLTYLNKLCPHVFL
jgi:hypothetical protein